MNLELFCCSGGMAEGFRRAGITFDFAVDADTDACDSYETNLGHRPLQMDIRDLLRMAEGGWRPGWLRLLVADPPCTPWSRAGKRKGTDDERDMLLDTVELIKLLKPTAYLIGNIPGLDDSNNWRSVVQPTLRGLQEVGYCVADFASLDAADFGVPQHRRRPFWFGHRIGDCIRWPHSTHGDWSTMRLDGLKPWVTCRDALQHLPASDLGRPIRLRKRRCNGYQHGSVSDKPARVVGESNLTDGNVLLTADRHGPNPKISNSQHGTKAIALSEKAAALLQGFPDDWIFAGRTKRSRWSQIGQAVPPALAEAVARSVARWFEEVQW